MYDYSGMMSLTDQYTIAIVKLPCFAQGHREEISCTANVDTRAVYKAE